jgi:hypothetical protein
LSGWFMGWNAVTTLMLASDVVILGMLNSVESVTDYSLTKYVPETLIGIIVIVIFGVMPGLGSIIGAGEYERAVRLRAEINALIWLVATTLGVSLLLWNRAFIGLWVGAEHFAGPIPNLLVVLAAMQLALIRSDGNIIDLTLRLSQKVLLGLLSVTVSIVGASILVGYFKFGIVGLCFGIIGGRLIISIGYPMLISHFLGVSLSSELSRIVRPAFVTILLFSIALGLDSRLPVEIEKGMMGWFTLIFSASMTGLLMLLVYFYAGLSSDQRRSIINRVRVVVTKVDAPQ